METLDHTDGKTNITSKYTKDISKPMTNGAKMNVRMAFYQDGIQKDGSTYVLKWEAEHGGFRQHAPEVIPDGPLSNLVLLKIQ